jgi:hypothetical protein
MQETYFGLLILLAAIPLIAVAFKPAWIFEYPFFIAGVFAVFILPQAYSLIRFPGGVRQEDVTAVMLMSDLCLGCAILGYCVSPSSKIVRVLVKPVNPDRMLVVALILIVVGASSILLIPNTKVEFTEQGGLTGIATIYLFFGGLSAPGFAIALQLLREKFTPMRLTATVLGSISPLGAVFTGRREGAVVFFVTIALSAYFTKRKAPKALVIFAALFFAMIAIPATGAYRGLVAKGEVSLSKVQQIKPVQNFVEFFTQQSVLELRNAAGLIRSTKIHNEFGLGRGYWNQIVYRFVPAQIFGKEFKESLMLGANPERVAATRQVTTFETSVGSTLTGMGDSYEQFGWFGCLFFAALGALFKSLWTAAMQPRALFAQVFYMMICTSAMRSVTHQTVDFLPGMLYQAVVLGVAYLYVRVPPNLLARAPQVRGRGSRWN